MAQASTIEWTDATWNPIRGCSRVSEGCRNCYAEGIAARFSGPGKPYEGLARFVDGDARWTGKIMVVPDVLEEPMFWRKPRRIFVNSMSDLFHENVDRLTIARIFAVMALTPHHTYQILTKRPERMREVLSTVDCEHWVKGMAWEILGHHPKFKHRDILARPWPLPNVWLGTSPCDQKTFDELVPALGLTPAAVRFLSIEPMLGPIDCGNAFDPAVEPYHPIDWVICGGESGAGARPMHPDWARSLRDQCTAAGVPFFFKQWGSCLPGDFSGENEHGGPAYIIDEEHSSIDYDDLGKGRLVTAHGYDFVRFPHKKTGRMLDWRTWDEFPKAAA
jgi:protein gp37